MRQIKKVSHSSKDVVTLNASKLVDDVVYISSQVEMLLYEDIKGRISVKLFKDSEPTLKSIALSRQVERILLRMTIKEFKENCLEVEVLSYAWFPKRI